jgi:hypothetical protein
MPESAANLDRSADHRLGFLPLSRLRQKNGLDACNVSAFVVWVRFKVILDQFTCLV